MFDSTAYQMTYRGDFMEVKQIDGDDLTKWIQGVNAAFKSRESERIPYEPITLENIIKMNRICFACLDESGAMVGGLSFEYNSDLRLATIGQVWVLPEKQGKGISDYILQYIERYSRRLNAMSIQLNVANIYKPAVNLYKKHGFKAAEIYANIPGTYYLIHMIKNIYPSSSLSGLKRNVILFKSKIIFHFLFKSDSSPAFGYKIYALIKKQDG